MKTLKSRRPQSVQPEEKPGGSHDHEPELGSGGDAARQLYERDTFLIESVSAFFKQVFETGDRTPSIGAAPNRRALAHLQDIVDHSSAVIYVKDVKGKFILINRLFEDMFAVSRRKVIGKTDYDIFPAEDARRFREDDQRVLKTGKPIEVKEVTPQSDGPHTYASVKFPLKSKDGSIYAEAGICTDITERTRSNESRRLLAAIVESSDDAIISKDLNGTITSWNQGAERIYGYSAAEAIGQPATLLLPPERHEEETEILHRTRSGERTSHYETVRRRKDGSNVNVSLTVSPIKNEAGQVVGASKIARDITARKRQELRQRVLYELTTAVNRAATMPEIYEAALNAICRCQNTERAAILLYDVGGIMRFKAWRNLSHEFRQAAERLLERKPDDPNPQPACIPDVSKAWWDEDIRAIVTREGIRAVAMLPIIYGKRPLGRFTLYYDAPHDFTQQEMLTAQTITSQVASAIERHERTTALREALVQMEEFSYSVSHDLRAPIRAMHSYAEVLLEDYRAQLDEKAKGYLGHIIAAGQRADRLIQDTLSYTRVSRREMHLRPVDLERLTREIVQQEASVRASHAQISIQSPLLPVIGHEPSLMQAISNLLSNAVKFVTPGTTPHVLVRTERRGNDVRLWIEDNGIGIKPEHQHRLFGMFERIEVKKNYEGTGIGLAIVRKAAERMGGKVGVESDGVNGSKFWMQLPETLNTP